MADRFKIKKRTHEDNALIAFIDLLGTRKLYESTLAEVQAERTLNALLDQFDIMFSDRFESEIINQHFDVSIFADSIVISVSNRTPKIVERLVDFLLDYQKDLFLLDPPSLSRAILTKDSFFSLKLNGASEKSILNSPRTNVSLCGGRGIKFADECLKGLPVGVYVTDKIKEDLNAEQSENVISVKNEELSFIKNKTGVPPSFLSREVHYLRTRGEELSEKNIDDSLEISFRDKYALKKIKPWVLVHLGMKNEIIRSEIMEWSSKKPTKEGYYWFYGNIKDEDSPTIKKAKRLVHIYSCDELSVSVMGNDTPFDLEQFDGLWMYIEEPEVP